MIQNESFTGSLGQMLLCIIICYIVFFVVFITMFLVF